MIEPKRRLVERVSDPSYADGLQAKSMEELRSMREEAREAENELSFERRLCHARMDILGAEEQRRVSGEPEGLDVGRLAEILAKEGSAGRGGEALPPRAPNFSIPRSVDVPRRRVEEIVGEQTLARLGTIQTEEIREISRSLAEHERAVSARRRAVHDLMDLIQAEIVRRYQSGEADPTSALA